MKGIYVFKNMPEYCGECPYCNNNKVCLLNLFSGEDKPCDVAFSIESNASPSWCPILPIPSKRMSMVEWKPKIETGTTIRTYEPTGYDEGWNDCLSMLEDYYD